MQFGPTRMKPSQKRSATVGVVFCAVPERMAAPQIHANGRDPMGVLGM